MKTTNSILLAAAVLSGITTPALASKPKSEVVFAEGTWVILDHARLPKPKLEKIARGVHIDPRLLQELTKPQSRTSSK
jgi:hypothetical protein